MSEAMEQLRRQLAVVIEEAARAAEAQRMAEQRQAAEAIEYASSSAAIKAAYEQGRYDEQRRTQAMIEAHRAMLGRGGVNAISLSTLAKLLQEA